MWSCKLYCLLIQLEDKPEVTGPELRGEEVHHTSYTIEISRRPSGDHLETIWLRGPMRRRPDSDSPIFLQRSSPLLCMMMGE